MTVDPYLSIADLHAGYRSGDLSPVDVVEAGLAREDRLEDKLMAYIDRYADDARVQAAHAAELFARRVPQGPLAGVPIALKDLVDIEGRITTGGSPERADRVSPATAPIARRLMEAGAIITGKTHTVEMAMGAWGTNEHLGAPWNPWDLETHRTPGGSSSGSGVAVAAGYVPGAIGTDTGGSVRIPAGWCGIVGLKVTEGKLPTDGIIPLSSTLDTPGPMVRTVDDAALMYLVLRGYENAHINHDLANTDGLFGAIRKPIHGMQLAILPDHERQHVDGEILAAYDASVETMANLGAKIVHVDWPKPFGAIKNETQVIISAEGYHFNKEILDNEAARVDPWVKLRLIPGKDYSADLYLSALEQRRRDIQAFRDAFKYVDGILMPTLQTPPIPIEDSDQKGTPAYLTRLANYMGLCGISLPNGYTTSGLPSGLMITCHNDEETTALRLAHAFEAATDFSRRPPGLA